MKLWVVMGNDYPDAVFDSEDAAEAYCNKKREATTNQRIHWRSYDFELNEGNE